MQTSVVEPAKINHVREGLLELPITMPPNRFRGSRSAVGRFFFSIARKPSRPIAPSLCSKSMTGCSVVSLGLRDRGG